jgi:hypothetical protein
MNVRQRLTLLIAAILLAAVAGCTDPSGGSGPGTSAQPGSSGKGDY